MICGAVRLAADLASTDILDRGSGVY